MTIRKFFHAGRQPEAYFMAQGLLFTACLAGFWDDGIEFQGVSPTQALGPGELLTSVKFTAFGRTLAAPDLCIVAAGCGDSDCRMQARVAAPADGDHLRRVMSGLVQPFAGEPPPEVDAATIPFFKRRDHYTDQAVQARRRWAEQICGAGLDHLARHSFNPQALAGNIENFIGAVQVPVGLAGPLLVKGLYVEGHVPLPVATTEGALVSAISRGARACNEAGGIQAHVSRQTMLRAPVFFCRDMNGAVALEQWILDHQAPIRAEAQSVSAVARLMRIEPHVFDNTLHVRFYFRTGDAAGQNMTSACTWMACRWIHRKTRNDPAIGLQSYMVEGNLSGDKKVNFQNFAGGRGIAVSATCRIPEAVLKKRLRVTAAQFVRCYQAGEAGGQQAGMPGVNINFANVIAGLFTATGQDIASVHESATGYLKARQEGQDLVLAVHLPSLVVGTVGGGTRLPTQRECLSLLGCSGPGTAFRLAEIIAAACLALDLSTGAAVSANEFVRAHETLGRNRPGRRLSWSEITPAFFGRLLEDSGLSVDAAVQEPLDTRGAILSAVAQSHAGGVHGLFRYALRVRNGNGSRELKTVLKIKPRGSQLVDVGGKVARLTGEDTLSGLFESQSHVFHLENSNVREIAFYRAAPEAMKPYLPKVYGTQCDSGRHIYAILMEDLGGCPLLNTMDQPEHWKPDQIRSVLEALAAVHAVHWNQPDSAGGDLPAGRLDVDDRLAAADLLEALTDFNAFRYPRLISPSLAGAFKSALEDQRAFVREMLSHPLTLTHNDFNVRNICLRSNGQGLRPVIYDWELACIQNPHSNRSLSFLGSDTLDRFIENCSAKG
ncbi:MAG: phosphotransferase [Desulfosarcinaceae bacterium]